MSAGSNFNTNISQVGGTVVTAGQLPTIAAQASRTSGTITANGQTVAVACSSYSIATVTVNGTYAGVTFTIEFSDDNQVTWYTLLASDSSSSTSAASSIIPGTNATKAYNVTLPGCTHVRLRATAYTSGTMNVGVTPTADPMVFNVAAGIVGTASVNLAQLNGTTQVTGGVAGTQGVGGSVATNVAIGTNPINTGAQAVSSENAAVTTTRMVQLVADLVGKLIVLPYANPENLVNGTTAAITDTTSTSTIASQGGSIRTYITSIIVTNSHATVGTFVKILDGASIIYEGYAAAAGGGFTACLPAALRGTAATAVNTQCVTTGANVIATVVGYKGV